MVDDYVLDNVLDRITRINDIKEFDNTKILIEADDILPDDIIFKNAVVLMTFVIKDDGKLYQQLFLEEALYDDNNYCM